MQKFKVGDVGHVPLLPAEILENGHWLTMPQTSAVAWAQAAAPDALVGNDPAHTVSNFATTGEWWSTCTYVVVRIEPDLVFVLKDSNNDWAALQFKSANNVAVDSDDEWSELDLERQY